MNLNNLSISQRQSAIVAGIALLIMAIIAPIASFALIDNLIVESDISQTLENIRASSSAFQLGIVLFWLVVVLDIVVAWALYFFFYPDNQSLSLLASWFRLVYSAVLAAAIIFLVQVSQLTQLSENMSTAD